MAALAGINGELQHAQLVLGELLRLSCMTLSIKASMDRGGKKLVNLDKQDLGRASKSLTLAKEHL